MSFEERNTWVFGAIALAGYATYLAHLFARADGGPLAEAPYVAPMLGTIVGAIVAGILGGIVLGILTPAEDRQSDVRDKQITRLGEQVGNSFVVLGGLGALVLSWLEVPHFWIANTLYLGFVLAAVLSTIAKLVTYRKGLPSW